MGGNSGVGSYRHFAEFKSKVINDFIEIYDVKDIIDFGCGDGNLLLSLKVKNYVGFDVSKSAISICQRLFKDDASKKFKLLGKYGGERADLSMSLDVIYHLIEDENYEYYMNTLFASSKCYVIIYSSNFDRSTGNPPHIKHRKFSDWIETNLVSFKLLKIIPNKFPYNGNYLETSFCDFYLYQRISLHE